MPTLTQATGGLRVAVQKRGCIRPGNIHQVPPRVRHGLVQSSHHPSPSVLMLPLCDRGSFIDLCHHLESSAATQAWHSPRGVGRGLLGDTASCCHWRDSGMYVLAGLLTGFVVLSSSSQSMFPGSAASAPPGNLLEMHLLWLCSRPTESASLGVGSSDTSCTKPSR